MMAPTINLVALMLASLLIACGKEETKPKKTLPAKSSSQIAKDLYDFEPAPPPPPPKSTAPPPIVTQVERPDPKPQPSKAEIATPHPVFEDAGPMLRAVAARDLRAERQAARVETLLKRMVAAEDVLVVAANRRLTDPDYRQRDPKLPEDRSTLPVKRFRVITADRYIGAILENSVNSQIPGRLIAVVERSIYGADDRLELLPKGTRIICDYKKLAKVGESRLPVACSRALRPDGASILLTDAQGADQMARTGFVGDVDNRIWERYGSAFIIAAISALASTAAQESSSYNYPYNPSLNNAGTALSQNLGQVTAKILEQSVDLAPIVTVPAASRIQIIPETDIWIREPELISSAPVGEE